MYGFFIFFNNISYLEGYEKFFCATEDSPIIDNKFNSYLFTSILANISKFDIIEWWEMPKTQYSRLFFFFFFFL